MQSVLSWIWTRVVVSISNDDNHYTTGTSIQYLCTRELHKRLKIYILHIKKKRRMKTMQMKLQIYLVTDKPSYVY